MVIDFRDYAFEPCPGDSGRGDGGVEVPVSVFGGSPPADAIAVVDRSGREVEFVGGGRVFIVDSAAGTEEFVGWSYWEDDDGYDSPAVQLLVVPE